MAAREGSRESGEDAKGRRADLHLLLTTLLPVAISLQFNAATPMPHSACGPNRIGKMCPRVPAFHQRQAARRETCNLICNLDGLSIKPSPWFSWSIADN